jgi:hypothetical protein
VLLAIRNLTRDRTRFGLSVAGVALAVMLILLLSFLLARLQGRVPRRAAGDRAGHDLTLATNQVEQQEASRRST